MGATVTMNRTHHLQRKWQVRLCSVVAGSNFN